MIAKWLLTEARLILLNDPTRGIDVGTKQEIYTLLRKLADEGKGIVLLHHRPCRADRLLRPRGHALRAAGWCGSFRVTS